MKSDLERAREVRAEEHYLAALQAALAETGFTYGFTRKAAIAAMLAFAKSECATRDAEIKRLRSCIEQSAGWFDGYAAEHYAKAKNAPDSREQHGREVKGRLNRERANYLHAALSNKDAG